MIDAPSAEPIPTVFIIRHHRLIVLPYAMHPIMILSVGDQNNGWYLCSLLLNALFAILNASAITVPWWALHRDLHFEYNSRSALGRLLKALHVLHGPQNKIRPTLSFSTLSKSRIK